MLLCAIVVVFFHHLIFQTLSKNNKDVHFFNHSIIQRPDQQQPQENKSQCSDRNTLKQYIRMYALDASLTSKKHKKIKFNSFIVTHSCVGTYFECHGGRT